MLFRSDLLLLGENREAGLENGGDFRGLQGFSLSGWRAPRFTMPGGQLELTAVVATPARPAIGSRVRGLW